MTEQEYINTQELTLIRSIQRLIMMVCPENSEVIDRDDFQTVTKILYNWTNQLEQIIETEDE